MNRTKSFVAGLYQRFDRAAGSMCRLPLVFFDQIVELDEVDLVDAEASEASLETRPSRGAGPFIRFGGHEEPVAVASQPGGDAQLGVTVGGGGVDVVHAELEEGVENGVGPVLAHGPERRRAEQHPAAAMAGPSELHELQHDSGCYPGLSVDGRPFRGATCQM